MARKKSARTNAMDPDRRLAAPTADHAADRTIAPIPGGGLLAPADLLGLQGAVGNRAVARLVADQARRQSSGAGKPIQRMIQIGNKLYYSGAAIKSQLPGKKDKDTELAEWLNSVGTLTGQTMVAAGNAYDIPGMDAESPTVGGALTTKLNSGTKIFSYASAYDMNNFLAQLQAGVAENPELMIHPKDLLEAPPDLTMKYDQGKGCVLQALINIDVPNPQIDSGEQDDAEAWHRYYIENNIMYDDDTVIYQIYTGLGLQLVWNDPTLWRNLDPRVFTPGTYVFSMTGHNFAVVINDKEKPEERYEPKDAPQNAVTTYKPDLKIMYAWRYT